MTSFLKAGDFRKTDSIIISSKLTAEKQGTWWYKFWSLKVGDSGVQLLKAKR
jgi:hypothetical protein